MWVGGKCLNMLWKVRSTTILNIYLILFLSVADSSVTIRRKISFLINSLLLPSMDTISKPLLAIKDGPTLHGSVSSDAPISPSPQSSPKPAPVVHPNSHASIVFDPSSANTSPMALKAMREHSVMESVLSALVDGKFEVDNQVQENCVKCVFASLRFTFRPVDGLFITGSCTHSQSYAMLHSLQ